MLEGERSKLWERFPTVGGRSSEQFRGRQRFAASSDGQLASEEPVSPVSCLSASAFDPGTERDSLSIMP